MTAPSLKMPTDQDAATAQSALELIRDLVQGPGGTHVRLRLSEDTPDIEVTIPVEAIRLLVRILKHMADGHAVKVLPVEAELTTQQTAEILNVSRPHVIKLIDRGDIACRKVGTHRRVLLVDLLRYKEQADARSKELLDDLTQEAQDMGLGY